MQLGILSRIQKSILKDSVISALHCEIKPSSDKMAMAKQACPRNRLLKALQLLGRRRRQTGSEQAGVSALRALRGLSADEFLDELLGRKLFV